MHNLSVRLTVFSVLLYARTGCVRVRNSATPKVKRNAVSHHCIKSKRSLSFQVLLAELDPGKQLIRAIASQFTLSNCVDHVCYCVVLVWIVQVAFQHRQV